MLFNIRKTFGEWMKNNRYTTNYKKDIEVKLQPIFYLPKRP